MTDQVRQLRIWRAILLSAFSVAWSLVIGAVAVAVALSTRSPSLAAFGLDAVVDAAASVTLIWYFRARTRDPVRAERLEKVTLRVVGTALIMAAAYVAVRSTILLIDGVAPGRSTVGIVIAAVSVAVLPFVALAKLRLAARIPSVALRSDGVLTGAAALLAGVVLVALRSSATTACGGSIRRPPS